MNYKITTAVITLLFTSILLTAQPAPGIVIKKDIIYGHAGGADLKLDMAAPEGKGPYPAVLFFHGGGWQAGDKSHGHHWIEMLVKAGYVGVSVGYRFAPAFKWPAQVEDAKAAVRYLRANASALHIDPDRIGVMGESAGGYLATMVGVTGPANGLEGDGGNAGFSSRVQAVVSYFSSSDFTLPRMKLSPEVEDGAFKYYKKPLKDVIADFMGTATPDVALLTKMSVVTYVDQNDPPTQIFQGDADPFVSVEQAKRFEGALEKAGVRHELILVKGGGHGWTGELKEKTNEQMMAFLERELKKK